jgi:hypothetical protein
VENTKMLSAGAFDSPRLRFDSRIAELLELAADPGLSEVADLRQDAKFPADWLLTSDFGIYGG